MSHQTVHCKSRRHSIDGDNGNLPTSQRHQHSSQNRTIGPQAKRSKLYKNSKITSALREHCHTTPVSCKPCNKPLSSPSLQLHTTIPWLYCNFEGSDFGLYLSVNCDSLGGFSLVLCIVRQSIRSRLGAEIL